MVVNLQDFLSNIYQYREKHMNILMEHAQASVTTKDIDFITNLFKKGKYFNVQNLYQSAAQHCEEYLKLSISLQQEMKSFSSEERSLIEELGKVLDSSDIVYIKKNIDSTVKIEINQEDIPQFTNWITELGTQSFRFFENKAFFGTPTAFRGTKETLDQMFQSLYEEFNPQKEKTIIEED